MPIEVEWDNDQHDVIRWDFEGGWNWDDVHKATLESVELRKTVTSEQPVSVILNLEQFTPLSTDALRETRKALLLRPENRDLVVVVGRSIYTQAIVDIFRRRYIDLADQFIGVGSVSEARRLIREHQGKRMS
jgi:hypothetical protein